MDVGLVVMEFDIGSWMGEKDKRNGEMGSFFEGARMVLIRTGGDESRHLFVAKSDNVRTLYSVLKAIQFREVRRAFFCGERGGGRTRGELRCVFFQRATVCATEKGLKVTVEDTKCVQANAFLQSDLFSQYVLKEENVNFCISLQVLSVSGLWFLGWGEGNDVTRGCTTS